jgi:hypothetical protein
MSLLRDLLAFGADPSVQQQDGWTALHSAARFGPATALKLLLFFKVGWLRCMRMRRRRRTVLVIIIIIIIIIIMMIHLGVKADDGLGDLGVQANETLQDVHGRSAAIISRKHKRNRQQSELLRAWATVRTELMHKEFHHAWRSFCTDENAKLGLSPPAKQILGMVEKEEKQNNLEKTLAETDRYGLPSFKVGTVTGERFWVMRR